MPKTLTSAAPAPVYHEERFRTPLAQERALGLWLDRLGRRQADTHRPPQFRVLGQYAAVAVEAGTGTVEAMGGEACELRPGDVILLPPQEAVRYAPHGAWDTRWVVWNGPEADALARLGALTAGGLRVRGAAPAVLQAWQRLDGLLGRQDFSALLGRKVALLELIRELAARPAAAAGHDPSFLEKAIHELTRKSGAPESVVAVARRLHLSPAQFRRRFKADTGTAPKEFQTAQRINSAKEWLARGKSIKETAAALGFTDVFHFMRLFRRVAGQTAGQFAAASAPPKEDA